MENVQTLFRYFRVLCDNKSCQLFLFKVYSRRFAALKNLFAPSFTLPTIGSRNPGRGHLVS